MDSLYKALEDLIWLTQLGLSMLVPLVALVGGCWWGVEHWGWPEWLYLPAFLVGIACGASTLLRFGRMMIRRAERDAEKQKRRGFNQHL